MKWRVRKPGVRHRALQMWHRWYAWYPVRVPTNGRMSGMTMVWRETILRKGEFYCYGMDYSWTWIYKLIERR